MAELCFSCFSQLRSSGVCPNCGYDPGEDKGKYHAALKPGTVLNGRYILGRVLGQGGFGITYAAQDFETKQRVAVKEYLPTNMASRELTGQVSTFGDKGQENFEHGKEGFMEEANALVDFKANPYIVNVHDFFEANNTAYFVMEYVQGTNLKAYIKVMGGKLGQEEANRILLPIMEALEHVHSKGLVHRDIAPDNIIVTAEGSAKLIDFGAARYSTGEKSLSLDVVLKHGYAPKEQYTRRGRQGAYTDVYAMAATYYYAVTGRVPPEAVDRMSEDDLIPPSTLGAKLSPHVEDALLKALEVQPADRYQTMGEFASAIKGNIEKASSETVVRDTNNTPSQTPSPVAPNANEISPPQNIIENTQKSDAAAKEVNITIKFGKRAKIIAVALATAIVLASVLFGVPYLKYQKACDMLDAGSYEEAHAQFVALKKYSDSEKMAKESLYQKASALLAEGKYDQAIAEFSALGDYSNSSEMVMETKYQKAVSFLDSAKFRDAYILLAELDGYGNSKAKLDECIYSWASNALAIGSDSLAKSFEQTVELGSANYATIYEKITDKINQYEDYDYWDDYWENTHQSSVVYNLLKTLPSTYEETSSLLKLFKAFSNGDVHPVSDYIRENREFLKSMWSLGFIKDFLTADLMMPTFLESYWTTSDNSYYFHFYEDEEEDCTYSAFNLPWVSEPKGTEYYDIQSSVYVWADENLNELAKVFKITVVDFDTIKIFCYKNNKTYTLFRN